MNPSKLLSLYFKYIDEHETFPEHMKKEMKDIVRGHFQSMNLAMGTIELTDMRAKDDNTISIP